jgi:hypothetical protein
MAVLSCPAATRYPRATQAECQRVMGRERRGLLRASTPRLDVRAFARAFARAFVR